MNNNTIGGKFEKYVQQLLMKYGRRTERNIMYHKGKKSTCQVDLEQRTGLVFREQTIYECKFVGPGSSFNFIRAYIQLGEALIFTDNLKGVIVTNAQVRDKHGKEGRSGVEILDRTDLLTMRFRDSRKPLEDQIAQLNREIRKTPYTPDDAKFIHKYI
ncbi:hypothetical protein ACFL3V_02030 [Nanoarchaeota archaeon]